MENVDVVVIGAGVIGLAIARAFAIQGREVIVIERNRTIGTGISSRNSEVIHAGIYYLPGTHKARLCTEGRPKLYDYCEQRSVAYRRCGKLIVATEDSQLPTLLSLAARAETNKVQIEQLSSTQARHIEPELQCIAALYSPSTGIIDSHGLMTALRADIIQLGSTLVFQSEVQRLRPTPRGIVVSTGTPEILATTVINAAGLHAISLAQRCEGLQAHHIPQAYFGKGSYFSLAARSPFTHLIYPIPPANSLGTHLTLDLNGQARFGPDFEWLDLQDPDKIDYAVDPRRATPCYDEVRRYWPALPDHALSPAYSGVRPKIHGPGEPIVDWRIDGPEIHQIPGLINLFGIESPGLTACLAIGDFIVEKIRS